MKNTDLMSRAIIYMTVLIAFLFTPPSQAQPVPEGDRYLGEQSCRHCHGGSDWSRMEQYPIWSEKDPHARAFRSLSSPLSQEIARWMGLPEGKPEEWAKCLRCHTGETDPALHGKHYRIEEGVSCESCHGRSEQWFFPHLLAEATHTTNVALGMTDLKDLQTRAQVCLKCHSELDHEIVAAGHPDLSFELLHYSFWQPPHWNYREASPLAFWAVGQAVAFTKALEDLSTADVDPTTGKNIHVEAFDKASCYACHHKLVQDRWRRVEGHLAVYRPLVERLAPESVGGPVLEAVDRIAAQIGKSDPGGRERVASLSKEAAVLADALTPRIAEAVGEGYKEEMIQALMTDLAQPLVIAPTSRFPQPQLPTAWVVQYFDQAEQKALALKCLALVRTQAEHDTKSLEAGVQSETVSEGERLARFTQSLDALWGFVESPTPEIRMRTFDPTGFNEALSAVPAP